MKSWKRITLVSFILIGGTASFGYWALDEFDNTLDNLSAPYLASTHSIYPSFQQNTGQQNTGLASTSLEISGELATSTDPEEIFGELATSTDETIPAITSTSTTATTTQPSPEATEGAAPVTITSTKAVLFFAFPQKGDKGDEVYIGCTYPISWQSSATINSLVTALVDAGAREAIGPIASGLAKENTIEADSQNLKWKVGVVWPGAYYIKVSKINGVEAEFRSKVFKINKMSENISTSEKENVCKESGGSF